MSNTGFSPIPSASKEAQEFFENFFSRTQRDSVPALALDDLEAWDALNSAHLESRRAYNGQLIEKFSPVITNVEFAGVPVLDIHPRNWADNGKVIVHIHGGGYAFGSALDGVAGSLPMAETTGMRVVSVDYSLAPRAKFDQVTNEVYSVLEYLIHNGYNAADIAITGDSAGAGLAAASALLARDRGLGLLGAAVLWSPWADVSCSGDSYQTLHDEEPCYKVETMRMMGLGYAAVEDQSNPYASPIHGNFKEGYPPTLIQVGTRELLLSDSVRLYQALDSAGQEVKLDVYEGMWHVFQLTPVVIPEAALAWEKVSKFICEKLA